METAGCRGESQEERPCASLHPSSLLSAGLHSHGSTPASPPQGPVRTGLQLHALSPPVRGPAPGWAESPNPDVCVALAAGGGAGRTQLTPHFPGNSRCSGRPISSSPGFPQIHPERPGAASEELTHPSCACSGLGSHGIAPGTVPYPLRPGKGRPRGPTGGVILRDLRSLRSRLVEAFPACRPEAIEVLPTFPREMVRFCDFKTSVTSVRKPHCCVFESKDGASGAREGGKPQGRGGRSLCTDMGGTSPGPQLGPVPERRPESLRQPLGE